MLAFHYDNDLFSFEGLLSLPALSTLPSSAWLTLDLDEPHFDGVFKQPDQKFEVLQELRSDYFHLQTHDVLLPKIDSASISSAPSDLDDTPAADDNTKKDYLEYDGDIWTWHDVAQPQISVAITSWDHFLRPSHMEAKAIFLSEAGPAAFDIALEQALIPLGKHLTSKVALPDKLVFALFELGCGRQSGLFLWDSPKGTFRRKTEAFGLLGTTQELQAALIEGFIAAGNTFKELADLSNERVALTRSQPLFNAITSAISVAVYAVTRYLERRRQSTRSLIQLQELFHKPWLLFERLSKLASIGKSGINASETITKLMNETQQLANGTVWLEDILSEVIRRTATPWLNAVAHVIGLSRSTAAGTTLRGSGSGSGSAQVYESGSTLTLASCILPLEIVRLITECETALQLLQAHEADHPLLTRTETSSWPQISWECSWEAIKRVQKRADDYERSLKEAIQNFTHGSPERDSEFEAVAVVVRPTESRAAQDAHVIELIDFESNTTWNQHLGVKQTMEGDRLDHLISTSLSADEDCSAPLAPPLDDTLNFSISPLLKAQHRLLSYSVLHLLFKKHDFCSHLRLHHQFQLLADGSFASRLSQALFDSEQLSGEGCRKSLGKTGLRLQTRDTWPPASSELRLVLTGILSDSFPSRSSQRTGPSKAQDSSLSDAMSFAIRDLSDEELDKCRDADSIYALDFLRLQYKPPSALLKTVLTAASQKKYDSIFKHLLRLLRLRSVGLSLIRSVSGRNCNSKLRPDHRLRVEMQFFVSTLAEYSANVAIRPAWLRFERLVEKVEKSLDRSDFDGAIAIAGGLQRLTEMHNEAIDDMLRALCLDKTQTQAKILLEDLFGLILRTAALMRRNEDMTNDYDENIRTTHKEFRMYVGKFIRYLQVQSDASTSNGSPSGCEALAFEQLLLKLTVSSYYGSEIHMYK